jgi:hypothetical protein
MQNYGMKRVQAPSAILFPADFIDRLLCAYSRLRRF